MKKILIIGKNSYIGKNLKQYLEKSTIGAKGQKQKDKTEFQVDSVSARSGEWKTLSFCGYDVVVMCSALVHKNEKKLGRQAYFESNTLLPLMIARKAKAEGVSQYIFLSSLAVYGRGYSHIDRDTSPKPETYYGQSKYIAEKKLQELENDDFRVAIVRLPTVYGKHAKGSYRSLKKITNLLPIFPRIDNQKSVISIENLCKYLQTILIRRQCGTFHPQDPQYFSTSELAQKAAAEEGKKIWLFPFCSYFHDVLQKKSRYWRKSFGNLTVDPAIDR